MNSFIQNIIDFVFPPKKEEIMLRELSPFDFMETAVKSDLSTSIFHYKNPLIRELVWQIKYKKNKHAIEIAGYCLYQKLKEYKSNNITLIPIPISKKRRKERGYNQCELIVDEIMRLDIDKRFKKDYITLSRNKHVERQTFKSRKERIENTKNIFTVVKTNVDPSSLIFIIDDATTTGSTLREAEKALEEVGYRNIRSLTIAH